MVLGTLMITLRLMLCSSDYVVVNSMAASSPRTMMRLMPYPSLTSTLGP